MKKKKLKKKQFEILEFFLSFFFLYYWIIFPIFFFFFEKISVLHLDNKKLELDGLSSVILVRIQVFIFLKDEKLLSAVTTLTGKLDEIRNHVPVYYKDNIFITGN